jgi:RNA polymerase sigma-70 factor (ECF subfamily)
MGVARGFFADEAKAEDVVQDVLLRLWQMRDRIDCQKDVRALAVRMTKNRCVSVWRHERVRRIYRLANCLHQSEA